MHNKCQITFWTPIRCSLTVVVIDITLKSRPKSFLQWKDCLFFKNLCYQEDLRSLKNALIKSRVVVGLAIGSLYFVPWGLSHSIIEGKMGEKLLSLWKQQFFEMFVYIDRLGPKYKCSYDLHNKWQNNLLNPYKVFPDSCRNRYYAKK